MLITFTLIGMGTGVVKATTCGPCHSVGGSTTSDAMSSRAEELHLRALPEPCVNLSIHTAPDVQPLKSTGERLCLTHRAHPVTGWPRALVEQRSPFGPVPLQNLQPYYGPLRPCVPHRYSGPLGFRRLDFSLGIGTTGSHVPHKSLARLRAAYMPDAARAGFRATPELIPGEDSTPGFDITYGISTRHRRFAFARLSGPYLTGSSPAFCCNAHHHRS